MRMTPPGNRGRNSLPSSSTSDSRSSRPDDEVRRRYQSIANDPKYRHFARIPRRIVRCLDYFGIDCDRLAVERRLLSFYLFIGVIDNAIDSGQVEASQLVLQRLESPQVNFDGAARLSDVSLMTEVLKSNVSEESYPQMLSTLRELHRAVVREQTCESMTAYMAERRNVGRLTARSSYLLIRPLLNDDGNSVCTFMERVGEIGCLVDSVIDLGGDKRLGLLGFTPTVWDFAKLTLSTFYEGFCFWADKPMLTTLFVAAIVDNIRDRNRPPVWHGRPARENHAQDARATFTGLT